jgi:hypothetical protein
MAFKTAKKVALVESDFLLGLRKGDRIHGDAIKALTMHRKGTLQLRILSSAVIEVSAALYSKGLSLPMLKMLFRLSMPH